MLTADCWAVHSVVTMADCSAARWAALMVALTAVPMVAKMVARSVARSVEKWAAC